MKIGFLKGSVGFFSAIVIFFIGYQTITHNNISVVKNPQILSPITQQDTISEGEITPPSSDIPTFSQSKENSYIRLKETSISGNLNSLIEITGTGVENIAYVHIGGINFTPIESEKRYYIPLNKNTFISGEYFIIINYKNGSVETLEQKLKILFFDEKLSISSFHPNIISNTKDSYITVIGSGFDKVISVQLNNNIILKKTDFKIIHESALAILIPKDLPIGKYYLNIMTTESVYEIPEVNFTIFQ